MPRTDQLACFQHTNVYRNEKIREKLSKGSPFDQAYVLYAHALEMNGDFLLQLKTMFRKTDYKVKGVCKQNLTRIAQKIVQNEHEKHRGLMNLISSANPYRITDMIRATIVVHEPYQMREAYELVKKVAAVGKVIRIKNKLKSSLQNVTLNFTDDYIIGEIQMRYGSKPINYFANHFLYELKRADSLMQLEQQIWLYCNHLVENDQVYAHEKKYTREIIMNDNYYNFNV